MFWGASGGRHGGHGGLDGQQSPPGRPSIPGFPVPRAVTSVVVGERNCSTTGGGRDPALRGVRPGLEAWDLAKGVGVVVRHRAFPAEVLPPLGPFGHDSQC